MDDAEAADTVLQSGAPAPTVSLGGKRAPPTAPSLDIPGYRVLRVLGEGGMGTVYHAEQEAPRRPVAIKVLHARSPSALARFRAEAEIMARLDHPGIARVLEAGEAQGQPYLVMEYVDGETIDRHARALGRRARLALVAELCAAVHHAHVKGVIHRDLKPSNVMVRPDGKVVVLDFGVARLAADDGSTPRDTRAGDLIGTPMYMSPEQARLQADQVDARSDVYTLGVILYELLCGALPYDVHGLSMYGVTRVISEEAPRPLGKRDPELRGDLEAIAALALRKDPAERYHSAAALREDLLRYLGGLPVSARTPTTYEQLLGFVRRRPLAATAIGGTAIGLAAVAAVVTALWLEARQARLAAEQAKARTELARQDLEARTNALTLRQARAVLARDPTQAVAWLATLTERQLELAAAWAIVEEALGRGVAARVLRAHDDEVHWVEPLPGGDGFVTGSYDGGVLRFDAPHFEAAPVFTAPRGRVHLVRSSPDGAALAVGGDDGLLGVVAPSGHVLARLEGHVGDVQHLQWSSDGATLVSSDDKGGVFVWPRGQAPGRRLASSTSAVGALALSGDGRALAAGDHQGALWLWQLGGDQVATTALDEDLAEVWTDGTRVRAVDARGTVWSLRREGTRLVPERAVTTARPVKSVVFSADGTWVAMGGVAGEVTVVRGEEITLLARHRAQVRALALTADGRTLASASDDGIVRVHHLDTGAHLTLRGHASRVRHLAFQRGALLSSDGEGVVRRWELPTRPAVLGVDGAAIERIGVAEDASALVTVDERGEVRLRELATGGERALGHAQGHVSAAALTSAGAVTATTEGELTFWRDPRVVRSLPARINALARRGDLVAAATGDGAVVLFSATGERLGTLAGNEEGAEAIALSPDGAVLASGGQDRVLRLWRVDDAARARWLTGAPQAARPRAVPPDLELPGPTGDTRLVAFSPRGDLLVSTGDDGAVLAWRRDRPGALGARDATGVVASSRATLTRHTGAVSALAFDADGAHLATAGRDHRLRVLALPTARTAPSAPNATADAAREATLPAAPTLLVFERGGALRAITRTGGLLRLRWPTLGAQPEVERVVDHGVVGGAALPPDRLALALEDGALVVSELAPHTFRELMSAVAHATWFRLPDLAARPLMQQQARSE